MQRLAMICAREDMPFEMFGFHSFSYGMVPCYGIVILGLTLSKVKLCMEHSNAIKPCTDLGHCHRLLAI